MQVWIIDVNGYYIDDGEKLREDISEFDITSQPTKENGGGFYKARWDFELKKWTEGATQEEIDKIKEGEEANKQPETPDKMGILEGKVDALTLENQEVLEYTVDLDFRIATLEMFM